MVEPPPTAVRPGLHVVLRQDQPDGHHVGPDAVPAVLPDHRVGQRDQAGLGAAVDALPDRAEGGLVEINTPVPPPASRIGLTWNLPLDGGGLVVSNQIGIEIGLEAVVQP
jgi:hypothetical protein